MKIFDSNSQKSIKIFFDKNTEKEIKKVKEASKSKIKIINQSEKEQIRELKKYAIEQEKERKNLEKIKNANGKKKEKLIEKEEIRKEKLRQKNEKTKITKIKKLNEKELKNYKKNNEEYLIKNTNYKKFLRFTLWSILLFIFLKGAIKTFKPSSEAVISKLIDNFKKDYRNLNNDYEVYTFAEQFVKNFFTYSNDNITGYKNSLEPFISNNFDFIGLNILNKNSKVINVNAYKKENCTNNQKNVFVYVDTEYIIKKVENDRVINEIKTEEYILKVPIYQEKNKFIIEDLPLFISDNYNKLNDYTVSLTASDIKLEKLDEKDSIKSKDTIANFLKNFCGGEQTSLDYYLSEKADKNKFRVLTKKTLKFKELVRYDVYAIKDNQFVAVVKYIISNEDGAEFPQNVNFKIEKNGDKFYIHDMDTKSINLNL